MSSTPELRTIENCAPKMEIAFKGSDRNLVHNLKKEGFFQEALCEDVLNPRSMLTEREKAGKMVEAVRDAVYLSKKKFHTLLAILRQGENAAYYGSIVDSLTEEFVGLGGVLQNTPTNSSSVPTQGAAANACTGQYYFIDFR